MGTASSVSGGGSYWQFDIDEFTCLEFCMRQSVVNGIWAMQRRVGLRVLAPVVFGLAPALLYAQADGPGSQSTPAAQPKTEVKAEATMPPNPAQVAALTEALKSETDGPHAVEQLTRLGAELAVPPLTKSLGADYPVEVRWRAARALGNFGPPAAPAIGGLIANLKDDDHRVRAYSCFALGRIGDKASEVAAASLVERVTDVHAVVRRAAIDALIALRPDRKILVPLLAKALEDAEPQIAVAAVQTLVGQGEAVVPALISALENEKAAYWATVALEQLGPRAAPAAPTLTKLVNHSDPEVRLQAIMTLAAIGEAARPAIRPIADRLVNDQLNGVRYAAAYALGKIGVDAQTQESLRQTMRSDNLMLAMVSTWALAQANPKDEQIATHAADLIVAGLKSDDPILQAAAARVLAESKISSDITAPALESALATASPEVVAHAVQAFAALGAKAVPRLTAALENEKLRPYALKVISLIGADAAEAVPALIKVWDQSEGDMRAEVQFALAAIGPAAAPAATKLVESLSSNNEQVKYSAMYALGRIGEQARDAAYQDLVQLSNSDDQFTRITAVWAMVRLDPGRPEVAETAVPLLTEALKSEREIVRIEAASTLGELGKLASPALPALKKALEDPSPAVKEAAQAAIDRIEG